MLLFCLQLRSQTKLPTGPLNFIDVIAPVAQQLSQLLLHGKVHLA